MNAKELQYMMETNEFSLADALVIAELRRRDEVESELRDQIHYMNTMSLERDQLKKERDALSMELERLKSELERSAPESKSFPNGHAEFYKRAQTNADPTLTAWTSRGEG